MRLDWQPGDAITSTRLTTIPETLKVASLPSDYEAWARGVRDNDDFIRELVNLGWPLRFAHAQFHYPDGAVIFVLPNDHFFNGCVFVSL